MVWACLMAYGRDSDAFCVANARVCSEASADLAFPCGCGPNEYGEGLNRWLGDG